ncbi:hypothetical protein [Pelosinus sp. UFO1]|uniref:hypothetical protein n=1 Tax=Pelosinus sp. UFO1 TaxID=484770 RepID=UPI0004D0BE4C|nr:hypothetical protein [Pelosinus sp. UFO1]AIF52044.1 hypothetical protein UFO1_2497 [Pelosinus sp. UFO1]
MLQPRNVVSIGEYRQIHRVSKQTKPSQWSILWDMLLQFGAVACFLIGACLAFGA